MNTLAEYRNGNCKITLLKNGTKIIEWEEKASPIYPVSIDLKITNRCEKHCMWCHENSWAGGEHARIQSILKIVKNLPKGTEIAIGGGDPFLHPNLEKILQTFSNLGLISNITVNSRHLTKHKEAIQKFRKNKLIYGLGVSWNYMDVEAIEEIYDKNTVIHFIAGLDNVYYLLEMLKTNHKCLVLGFKKYGRAKDLFNMINTNLNFWKVKTEEIIHTGHVAFDTLGTTQLEIKNLLPKNIWEECFMGEDGEFTMYIDAVKQEFAKSSTAKKYKINRKNIEQMFQYLRNNDL